jgi:hypothetical protein
MTETLLVNQQPPPTSGITALPRPLTVWVGCLWNHGDHTVKEVVPARATHRADGLVLCDFYDPRSGPSRVHWMEEEFVKERVIAPSTRPARQPDVVHPAAAPSPRHDVGSKPNP